MDGGQTLPFEQGGPVEGIQPETTGREGSVDEWVNAHEGGCVGVYVDMSVDV